MNSIKKMIFLIISSICSLCCSSQIKEDLKNIHDSDIVVNNLLELQNLMTGGNDIANIYYVVQSYPCDMVGNQLNENLIKNDSILYQIKNEYKFAITEVWVTGKTPTKYSIDYSMKCVENLKKHFESKGLAPKWYSCNTLKEECYISKRLKLNGNYNFILKLRKEGQ